MASNNDDTEVNKRNLILKSTQSVKQSFVRFHNYTSRRVDCIWINYEGRRVKYKTLGPNQYFDVNTFVSHPWIFRDSKTHDKMHVSMAPSINDRNDRVNCNLNDDNEVFMPPDSMTHPIVSRKRRLIFITLPVYTLKERCFQLLRDRLTGDVSKLEIPSSLISDYQNWIKLQC